MKRKLLFLFGLFLNISLVADTIPDFLPELEREMLLAPKDLKGDVESVLEKSVRKSGTRGIEELDLYRSGTLRTLYNKQGRISAHYAYDTSGVSLGSLMYDYDGKGNRIRMRQTEKTDAKLISCDYSYDDSGRVSGYVVSTGSEGVDFRVKIKRGNSGEKQEEIRRRLNGIPYLKFAFNKMGFPLEEFDILNNRLKTRWKYDRSGRLISRTRYNGSVVTEQMDRTYDTQGRIRSELRAGPKQRIEIKCQYNESGARKETETVYQENEKTEMTVTVYDPSGRPVSKEFYRYPVQGQKRRETKERYEYNGEGDQVKISVAGSNNLGKWNSVYTRQYTYDSRGNWIRAVTSINGKEALIREREITYR